MNDTMKRHTISLFVSNKPGVLIRVALVFARRGYNIDSLVVSASNDPHFSRMNITARGDQKVLDQIIKQLNKLVDVVSAHDRTNEDIIQKELALFKLACSGHARLEVFQLADAMKCTIIDVMPDSVIIEIEGNSERIDSACEVFKEFDIVELMRTGKVLMARGLKEYN